MEDQHLASISSSSMAIRTRVCPCGNVYLYVGHTCLYLRQEEFLMLRRSFRLPNATYWDKKTVTDKRQHQSAQGIPHPCLSPE
jgi:hypothetical protein